MNSATSIKLFKLIREFIKDESKARTFVEKIEEVIDDKFDIQKEMFLTKEDKVDLMRAIYLVGLVQFLAIVGSVLAIVNFML